VAVSGPSSDEIDALQRAIVRLQLDPAFAEAFVAGASLPGVGALGERWLRAVHPAAWGAEPERREQVLGNLFGEFPLAVACCRADPRAFLGTAACHDALDRDAPLALAFAAFLESLPSWAPEVARLEAEMARARRLRPSRPVAALRWALGVRRVLLPRGTLAYAGSLQVALGAGAAVPPAPAGAAREAVVLAPRPGSRWAVPAVHVEVLDGAVDALVSRAEGGLSRRDLQRFARAHGTTAAGLAEVVGGLVADGILDRHGPIV